MTEILFGVRIASLGVAVAIAIASKIYWYSGLVLIGALPLLLLFRTGRARGSVGPVH